MFLLFFLIPFAISTIIVHLWLYSDNVNPQPRQGSWGLILVYKCVVCRVVWCEWGMLSSVVGEPLFLFASEREGLADPEAIRL